MPEPKDLQSSPPDPSSLPCEEFRRRHSEHLDGLLPAHEHSRWASHARSCLPCARYDRAVRRSCELARALPPLSMSEEFDSRLRHRIFHVRDEEHFTRRGSGSHVAVSLTVAGLMAVLAWTPLLREGADPVELAPVQARAPETRSTSLGATRVGWRVNLFSSEAALPGAWLTGHPGTVPLGTRVRRDVFAEPRAYPAFLMDPAYPSLMPGGLGSEGARTRE